jgi:hypothetical protein
MRRLAGTRMRVPEDGPHAARPSQPHAADCPDQLLRR